MTLRLRLTLWNVGVLALALILLGAALRARLATRLYAELDRTLRNSRPKPPPMERRGGFGRHEPREFPAFLLERRLPHRLPPNLYTAQGEGSAPPHDAFALRQAVAVRGEVWSMQGEWRIYTVPLYNPQDGRLDGIYQNRASLRPVVGELRRFTGELLTLLPFALLAAGAGGMFLTNRALRPIRAVTEAAAQIEASDLSRRLEVKGKDELAQLAGTFNGMLTRLETAFTRQRQFVADASHELRSPLTVIKANAEYGLTDDATDSSSRTLFEKINRASDRTIRLVQSLLTLARSDAHTLPVERGTIALPTLFAEVVEEARALHPDGARIDVQAGVETLTGDRALLLQLLLNLTDNALRHTPATGTVTLSAQAEGEGVRLTVTDTGGGVAPEHLPHLTERFYRADAARSRHQGGTGLGLAICKAITEAHGGTLTVENEDGVGLRVAVMLPG